MKRTVFFLTVPLWALSFKVDFRDAYRVTIPRYTHHLGYGPFSAECHLKEDPSRGPELVTYATQTDFDGTVTITFSRRATGDCVIR